MNSGEVVAQNQRVVWRDGRIVVSEKTTSGASNVWLMPALLDLQVNGYGGVDYQSDGIGVDELLSSVRQLRRDGCAQIFLTLITDAWPKLMARLKRLKELRSQSPELQSAIAGWHIEGPFLSHLPGFHGAHNPALMIDPKPEHIRELRAITEKDPVLLTVAPERAGAIAAIELASSLGIVISLGHTNASHAELQQAVKAGAKSFTHLGNGCPQQLDRHDNILWRVLDTPGLTVGLIPDKMHVSPALFRIFWKQFGAEKIWLTTDAVAPGGAPPGRYRLGALEVDVGADQIVRQPGRTNFAGSALRPIDGIVRSMEMMNGERLQKVWEAGSDSARKMFGLPAALKPDEDANFCVLTSNEAGAITKGTTYFRGEPTEMAIRHPYS
jgi:N-acetylglucosamine-6-phosphate deacetylase